MNEELYREAARFFGKGKTFNRNSFINRAVEFFVQANARRKLADEFKRASLAQRNDPKVMAEIRPDFREIIILHNTEELTFEEISQIVDKPLNTVKSQYRRALHQMRELLRIRKYGGEL